MTILPSDPICVGDTPLICESLCSLCQRGHRCSGASSFIQEKLFYNFDQITKIIYPIGTPRSADACYLKNQEITFIEIKNREVDGLIFERSIQKEIVEKLLDSIYTVKKNPNYFKKLDIVSFNLLYSHLKRKGDASMKLNLRVLGNTAGITFSNSFVKIPVRAINLYSTHVKKHHREVLTEPSDMVLDFKLCFCDSIDETILK